MTMHNTQTGKYKQAAARRESVVTSTSGYVNTLLTALPEDVSIRTN